MYKLFLLGIVGALFLMIVFKPIAYIWLRQNLDYQYGLIFLMMVYSIIYMWNAIYSQIVNGLSLMKVLVPNSLRHHLQKWRQMDISLMK